MVTSIVLPKLFTGQLNRRYRYSLYAIVPRTHIGKALPFGYIWWQRGKQRWMSTLNKIMHRECFLEVRVDSESLGVMYVRDGVLLKLNWVRTPTVHSILS